MIAAQSETRPAIVPVRPASGHQPLLDSCRSQTGSNVSERDSLQPSGSIEPVSTTIVPMETARLESWIASSKSEYLDDLVRSGEPPEQASNSVESTFARYFPQGKPAHNHLVYDVVTDGRSVGYLWIGPHATEQISAWWVWDIAIDADQRGKGFGREAMLLAEDRVREHGGSTLGLNVFGFNAAGRALYESLSYETTSVRMLKKLS